MLDVHPPHTPTHTWRDFFIHIATISVGLLIAVGIEQTEEAVHHHHQREHLQEEMRTEAEHNIATIQGTLNLLTVQTKYLTGLQSALANANIKGDSVEVAAVPHPEIQSAIIISPSRGTWAAAQTSGVAALLHAEQAKIYGRLDYNADEQFRAEDVMVERLGTFDSEAARAHYIRDDAVPSVITAAHRDDLLYRIDQVRQSVDNLAFRLAIMQGADEAIAAGVRTMAAMYPYQKAALARVQLTGATGRFFVKPRKSSATSQQSDSLQ